MSNRRKNAQNCWFFRRAPSSFLSKNAHERVHQGGFHFLGALIDFVWNTNCFLEHELNTNCSEINETMNGHSWRNSSCWERTLFDPLLKH